MLLKSRIKALKNIDQKMVEKYFKKMLTRFNKNVIIENVDRNQQDLRKSKIEGKNKIKNILKKC